MVVVVAVMKAKSGKEGEMEKALNGFMPAVEKEEGTLSYILHRSKNDAGKFLVYEKYRDGDALAYHGSTKEFQELFLAVAPLLDGDPSIEIFEEIAAKEAR